MTREEAVNWFEAYMMDYHDPMEIPDDLPYEVAELALSALSPVSREQVEQMRGEWISTGAISCKCSKCNKLGLKSRVDEYNFCPHCMAPMTDEAVDMVMERLEALKDGKGD